MICTAFCLDISCWIHFCPKNGTPKVLIIWAHSYRCTEALIGFNAVCEWLVERLSWHKVALVRYIYFTASSKIKVKMHSQIQCRRRHHKKSTMTDSTIRAASICSWLLYQLVTKRYDTKACLRQQLWEGMPWDAYYGYLTYLPPAQLREKQYQMLSHVDWYVSSEI